MKHMELGFGGLIRLTELTGKKLGEVFKEIGEDPDLALIRDIYMAARYFEAPELSRIEAEKEIDEAIQTEKEGFLGVLKAVTEVVRNCSMFKKTGNKEKKIPVKKSE